MLREPQASLPLGEFVGRGEATPRDDNTHDRSSEDSLSELRGVVEGVLRDSWPIIGGAT